MSKALAKCERTGKIIPLLEGAYVAPFGTREWQFVAITDEIDQDGDYMIPVAAFSKSPQALVVWMDLLNQKAWFDPKKLADFFTRLKLENNLGASL